jgi:cysteine synthase
VKLEWENPTGSVKDRMAHAVISRAEATGRLKPGDTVIEYTGGSTGASLGPGAKVVTLMADSGLKYLNTDVYKSR